MILLLHLVDDVKGLKIGIPRDYFGEGLDPEVKESSSESSKECWKRKVPFVEEFDLSLVEYAIPAYYVIASAEASSNLARFDGVKYGYRTKEYDGLHNMYKKIQLRRLWTGSKTSYHAWFFRVKFRLL